MSTDSSPLFPQSIIDAVNDAHKAALIHAVNKTNLAAVQAEHARTETVAMETAAKAHAALAAHLADMDALAASLPRATSAATEAPLVPLGVSGGQVAPVRLDASPSKPIAQPP
jgi:hypothetical protein